MGVGLLPEPHVLVTIPAIIGWLAVIERASTYWRCVLWLAVFGAVATVLGYRWLPSVMMDFGGVSASLAWLATGLFGVFGVVHGMIFAAFYRGMTRRGHRPSPLVAVALLVALEALPIRLFPWSGGHGAVDVPPLLQAAAWGGVPAVSFALYCLVFPIYEWLRWAFVRGGTRARPGAALVTFLIGVAIFAAGAWRYERVRTEEREAERHLRVAIVQANVGSHAKRGMENGHGRLEGIAAYREVTQKAAKEKPELIVWPETAITDGVPLQRPQQTHQQLRFTGYDFLTELGRDSAFMVGLYEQVKGRESLVSGKRVETRYNVAALRQAGGAEAPWTAYRKIYLIPFGEMTPFNLFDTYLPQQTFKMAPGKMPQDLLETQGLTFAPFICYEGILPNHVRAVVGGKRPDVLISLTNDSWFGGSWEPYQHLNFTRFRSVEHGVPMVRATNTGVSAFVSATGDVEARLDLGVRDALVREVPIVDREPTIFVKIGYRFPVILWIVGLLGFLLSLMKPPPVVYEDD